MRSLSLQRGSFGRTVPSVRALVGGNAFPGTPCAGATSAPGLAAWTVRAVRLVVPSATDGSTDVAARILAGGMGQPLGQPVVVENRAGSGGLIGANTAAKAESDGYALVRAATGLLSIAPHLCPRTPFDRAVTWRPFPVLRHRPRHRGRRLPAGQDAPRIHPPREGGAGRDFLREVRRRDAPTPSRNCSASPLVGIAPRAVRRQRPRDERPRRQGRRTSS